MSDFFDSSSNRVVAGSLAVSTQVNNLRDEIGTGFDNFPPAANVKASNADYGTESGSANAYVVTMPFTQLAYTIGMSVCFIPGNSNTTASTLNVDTLGTKPIKCPDGTDITAGDIVVDLPLELRYDGTNFVYTGSWPNSYFSAVAANKTAAETAETNAGTSASNASTSETNASNYASATISTSTTSLLIEVAEKTFTTQADKQYVAGQFVIASSAAGATNYMHGQVTSYSGTTLVVEVSNIGGSGTLTDWNLSISGSRGATGATGVPVVYVKTSSVTLTATEVSGLNTVHNNGAGAEVILTWLALVTGQNAIFYVNDAQYLQIKAPAATTIKMGTLSTAAAGYVRSNIVGNWIQIKAMPDGLVVVGFGGTWTYDE